MFIPDELRQRDLQIRSQCAEKMKVYGDMVDLFGREGGPGEGDPPGGGTGPVSPYADDEQRQLQGTDVLLQAAIQQGQYRGHIRVS